MTFTGVLLATVGFVAYFVFIFVLVDISFRVSNYLIDKGTRYWRRRKVGLHKYPNVNVGHMIDGHFTVIK